MNIKAILITTLLLAPFANSYGMEYLRSMIKPFIRTDPKTARLLLPTSSMAAYWTLAFDKRTGECILNESYPLELGAQELPIKIVIQRWCRSLGL